MKDFSDFEKTIDVDSLLAEIEKHIALAEQEDGKASAVSVIVPFLLGTLRQYHVWANS
ncbi:MAG: hypothetical protein IJ113_07295 [Eggerthellaceae bacterium]|nr:hypothetical protein [Eggerthellaceae bacterium]